ncbi:hypothetical protein C8A05DRAFT_38606 [Staphylotrichum tortipilum]|uniref:Uncharacterized protein n=1 Tax=Staphylotrichum tortipilum TaxID=2831512 RepID=A0AAN6MCA2_9PEZI|nr:hypothetical protein C8A05DRAFT_38606 [Staphylotrichum longicolle]
MDTSSATPTAVDKSPSLHSKTSSITLIPEQPQPTASAGSGELPRYIHYERTGDPNPEAQPKHKSRFNKLMSKFQSPAVKRTVAVRERELLEEERTGIKKHTTGSAASDPGPATAAHYAFSGGGSALV